jgi:hypothetical protein
MGIASHPLSADARGRRAAPPASRPSSSTTSAGPPSATSSVVECTSRWRWTSPGTRPRASSGATTSRRERTRSTRFAADRSTSTGKTQGRTSFRCARGRRNPSNVSKLSGERSGADPSPVATAVSRPAAGCSQSSVPRARVFVRSVHSEERDAVALNVPQAVLSRLEVFRREDPFVSLWRIFGPNKPGQRSLLACRRLLDRLRESHRCLSVVLRLLPWLSLKPICSNLLERGNLQSCL